MRDNSHSWSNKIFAQAFRYITSMLSIEQYIFERETFLFE